MADRPDPDTVASHRERLQLLDEREREIRGLRERESALEADHIAADTALERAAPTGRAPADTGLAAAAGVALERVRGLERRIAGLDERIRGLGGIGGAERRRLEEGLDALRAWLDAAPARNVLSPVLQWLFLAVIAVIVWLAVTVHIALLILLVPVGGATSFLFWTGHDTAWKRTGAQRRFAHTGLAGPARWERAEVEACAAEVAASLEAAETRGAEPGEPEEDLRAERATASAERAEAEIDLAVAAGRAGLDLGALDDDTVRWLELLGQSHVARRGLRDIAARLRDAREESAAVREDVYRFLSRAGVAPPDGRADRDSLEAGLDRAAALAGQHDDAEDAG